MKKYTQVTVYVVPNAVAVVPCGKTTQGFRYEVEPIFVLPPGCTDRELCEAICAAQTFTNQVVPHPTSWNGHVHKVQARLGFRSARTFNAVAKIGDVRFLADVIELFASRINRYGALLPGTYEEQLPGAEMTEERAARLRAGILRAFSEST